MIRFAFEAPASRSGLNVEFANNLCSSSAKHCLPKRLILRARKLPRRTKKCRLPTLGRDIWRTEARRDLGARRRRERVERPYHETQGAKRPTPETLVQLSEKLLTKKGKLGQPDIVGDPKCQHAVLETHGPRSRSETLPNKLTPTQDESRASHRLFEMVAARPRPKEAPHTHGHTTAAT